MVHSRCSSMLPSSSICRELPAFFSLFCHTKTGNLHVCPSALVFVPYVQPSVVFTPAFSEQGCYHDTDTACHDDDSVEISRARDTIKLTSNTRRRNLASELLLQSFHSAAPVGITTCVLHISSFLYYFDIFTIRFTAANDDKTKLGNDSTRL